ncbi:hypothetical protein FRC09_014373 [Ceratobasidium sp. 395]|nr:hypothetical protein FRC09_014373 [Ceratobasidium sp. 395]
MLSDSESDTEMGSRGEVQPSPIRPKRIKVSRAWEDWESLLVVEKARQHRPWEAKELDGGKCGTWNHIALELHDEHEGFNRSGMACQTRLNRMLRHCKAYPSVESSINELVEDIQYLRGQRFKIVRSPVPQEEQSEGIQIERQQKRPPPSSNPSLNSASMLQRKRARNSSEAESLDEALATLEAKEEAHDRKFEDTREEKRERHKEIIEKLDGVADAIERLADVISEDSRDTRTLLEVVDKRVKRRNASQA